MCGCTQTDARPLPLTNPFYRRALTELQDIEETMAIANLFRADEFIAENSDLFRETIVAPNVYAAWARKLTTAKPADPDLQNIHLEGEGEWEFNGARTNFGQAAPNTC
ncbi:hypothetical protein TNCV_2383501 [Trichonephila clavipes]|nr:hypothetical protein TNCV_2383501 [Trichonephila clavipes]